MASSVKQAFSQLKTGFEPSDHQIDALKACIELKHSFVTLPTGCGKSYIFLSLPKLIEIISGVKDAIVLVVCPLVALMKSHVQEAGRLGVNALTVESKSDISTLKTGDIHIALASAETWLSEIGRAFIKEAGTRVKAVFLDEAHIMPKWGLVESKEKEKAFRAAFGQLGQLRSLVPVETPISCLTATATTQTMNKVLKIMAINKKSVQQIYVAPNRCNIKMTMISITQAAATDMSPLHWIVSDLIDNSINAARTIIYCKSILDCAKIYREFIRLIGNKVYLENQPQTARHRLIAMYHHSTPSRIKELVLESLLDKAGSIRVVIATTALSMGVNFPNIRKVVQYGPPKDIEEYLQQIGRAGRDGEKAAAIMYWSPRHLIHCDNSLKCIAKDGKCIRASVLQFFQTGAVEQHEPLHDCCSRCHAKCKCAEDRCSEQLHDSVQLVSTDPIRSRTVEESDLETLKEALNEAKDFFNSLSYPFSEKMTTNFSNELIKIVMEKAEYIFDLQFIMENVPIYKVEHAKAVLEAVQETFEDFQISGVDQTAAQLDTFEELLLIDPHELVSVEGGEVPDTGETMQASEEFSGYFM